MDHGDGRWEKACIKPGKVNIREIVGKLEGEVRPRAEIAMPGDVQVLKKACRKVKICILLMPSVFCPEKVDIVG